MKLRRELEPIQRSDEFKQLIRNKIEHIKGLLENNQEAKNEIAEFNATTGRKYDEYYFQSYWKATSIDEFIAEACSPEPKKDEDITKEELIELVKRVMDYDTYKEDTNFYLQVLKRNIIMPEVSNLIFWSDEELTAEEIVEKALSYKPIIL